MTVKFKTTLIETSEEFTGEMEDLGLCYVSRFSIGREIFLSVSSKDVNASERLEYDKLTLEAEGYSDPQVIT